MMLMTCHSVFALMKIKQQQRFCIGISDVLPYFHSCLQVLCNSNKKHSITCVFHISFSRAMIKKGIIQSIILNWKPSIKFWFTHSFLFILFMLIFLCIYLIDQLEITKFVTEFSSKKVLHRKFHILK